MIAFNTSPARSRAWRGVLLVCGTAVLATSHSIPAARAFGLGSMSDVSKTLGSAGNTGPSMGANEATVTVPPAATMPKPAMSAPAAAPMPSPNAASPEKPATPPAPQAAAKSEPSMPGAAPAMMPSEPGQPKAPAAKPAEAAAAPVAAPGVPVVTPAPKAAEMAPVPSAPKAATTPASGAPSMPPAKPVDKAADFYGDRAKELLAEEQKGAIKFHPLQLASPDYDVTVCEAGCKAGGPQVLSKQLKSAKRSATADAGVAADVAKLARRAECRGGCYDAPSGLTKSAMSGPPKMMGEDAGNWMTTVSPAAEGAAPAAAAPAQPAAKKGSREDWMSRINRERDGGKAPGDAPSMSAPKS